MLQKEFEERMGHSVSDQEYLEANAMYEIADDMDKDEFCKEYKKYGKSKLMGCLADKVYRQQKALQNLEVANKELLKIKRETAEHILKVSVSEDATEPVCEELEQLAWWLVGMKEIVKMKARMLISYSKREIEYIDEHLE